MYSIKRIGLIFLIIVMVCSFESPPAFSHGDEVAVPSKEQQEAVKLSPDEIESLGVKTAKTTPQSIAMTFTVSGAIKPLPNGIAVVSSRVPGKLIKALANPGDRVKQGQVLAEIYSPQIAQLHTSFQQAKNKADLLLKEKLRAENLFEKKIGTLKDIQQKESDYQNGLRELQGLAEQMHAPGLDEEDPHLLPTSFSTLTLRAPIGGTVIERNVDLGETFSGEKNLFRIANISRVIAEGDAFEDKIPLLKKGMEIRVKADIYPDRVFTGKISYVGLEIDPEKRTVHFWAEINNKELLLRPNMFVSIDVETAKKKVLLAIPQNALFNENGEKFVLVQEDQTFHKTLVTTGMADNQYLEISSGLVPGDEVVTAGKREIYTRLLTGSSIKKDEKD